MFCLSSKSASKLKVLKSGEAGVGSSGKKGRREGDRGIGEEGLGRGRGGEGGNMG